MLEITTASQLFAQDLGDVQPKQSIPETETVYMMVTSSWDLAKGYLCSQKAFTDATVPGYEPSLDTMSLDFNTSAYSYGQNEPLEADKEGNQIAVQLRNYNATYLCCGWRLGKRFFLTKPPDLNKVIIQSNAGYFVCVLPRELG